MAEQFLPWSKLTDFASLDLHGELSGQGKDQMSEGGNHASHLCKDYFYIMEQFL